jgi:predicted ATP-grasp superfamily ATP-dependent carboligase
MSDEQLMIIGASTRAAAQSAVRAGFEPVCADHFADEDLFEVAEVLPLSRYPQGLIAAACCSVGQGRFGRRPTMDVNRELVGQRPPTADLAHRTPAPAAAMSMPWMYTGALENHPRILKKLASLRPLCGNPADVVVRVRDPFAVARVLAKADFRVLRVFPTTEPPPTDGRWLLKPRRGAGGRGIRVWDGAPIEPARRPEPCYFQQRVRGDSYSGLYLATSAGTVFVGAARQLIGEPKLGAGPFAYCGSVGPVALGERLQRQLVRCGEILAAEFGLRGLFGIDFVIENDAVAWLTEVNPRYTASVEIFETALGLPLLRDHVLAAEAFGDVGRSSQIIAELRQKLAAARSSSNGRMCGKAVVYAPFSLRAPGLADLRSLPTLVGCRARVADRPRPGTVVPARAPLCTLLVEDLGQSAARSQVDALAPFEPALALLRTRLEPCRHESQLE